MDICKQCHRQVTVLLKRPVAQQIKALAAKAWHPEFDPWDPYGNKELTLEIFPDLHTCEHTQPKNKPQTCVGFKARNRTEQFIHIRASKSFSEHIY